MATKKTDETPLERPPVEPGPESNALTNALNRIGEKEEALHRYQARVEELELDVKRLAEQKASLVDRLADNDRADALRKAEKLQWPSMAYAVLPGTTDVISQEFASEEAFVRTAEANTGVQWADSRAKARELAGVSAAPVPAAA